MDLSKVKVPASPSRARPGHKHCGVERPWNRPTHSVQSSPSKPPADSPRRPKSAPVQLLRGDGALSAHGPIHKDPFLQKIEDTEVQRSIAWMRREQHTAKALVCSVDSLSDSSISDLRLMHCGPQRRKGSKSQTRNGSSPISAPASGSVRVPEQLEEMPPGWEKLSVTERVRKLQRSIGDHMQMVNSPEGMHEESKGAVGHFQKPMPKAGAAQGMTRRRPLARAMSSTLQNRLHERFERNCASGMG